MDALSTFDMSCVRWLPFSLSDVSFDASDNVVATGDQIKQVNVTLETFFADFFGFKVISCRPHVS